MSGRLRPHAALIAKKFPHAGSQIAQIEGGHDGEPVTLMLLEPFRAELEPVDPDLIYRAVNNRAIWMAQYMHVPSGDVLA